MKNIFLSLFLFVGTSYAIAQKVGKPFFEKSNSVGGFGVISVNYAAQHAYFSGEGAIRLQNLYVGGFGQNQSLSGVSANLTAPYTASLSHGGVMVGYFTNPAAKFTLHTDVQLGFGTLLLKQEMTEHLYQVHAYTAQSVIPRLGVDYALIPNLKLGAFMGYQFIFTETNSLQINQMMQHPAFGLRLSLGAFN